MLITVTADDIEKGMRGKPMRCPVARAIQRATNRKDFQVGSTTFLVMTVPLQTFPLPDAVFDFVKRLDTGKKVEPFTFDLEWT